MIMLGARPLKKPPRPWSWYIWRTTDSVLMPGRCRDSACICVMTTLQCVTTAHSRVCNAAEENMHMSSRRGGRRARCASWHVL
jgi:hypothetical protein